MRTIALLITASHFARGESPIWVIIQRISWRDFLISSRCRAGDVSKFPPASTYARIASLIAWDTLQCFLFAIFSSFSISAASSLILICLVMSILSNDLAFPLQKIKIFPGELDLIYLLLYFAIKRGPK